MRSNYSKNLKNRLTLRAFSVIVNFAAEMPFFSGFFVVHKIRYGGGGSAC